MRVIAVSAPVLPLEFIAQSRTSIILHRQADTEGIGGPLAGRLAEAATSMTSRMDQNEVRQVAVER